jgi:hypothetical protein
MQTGKRMRDWAAIVIRILMAGAFEARRPKWGEVVRKCRGSEFGIVEIPIDTIAQAARRHFPFGVVASRKPSPLNLWTNSSVDRCVSHDAATSSKSVRQADSKDCVGGTSRDKRVTCIWIDRFAASSLVAAIAWSALADSHEHSRRHCSVIGS